MKLLELIEKLEIQLALSGDLEVVYLHDFGPTIIEQVTVANTKDIYDASIHTFGEGGVMPPYEDQERILLR